MGIPDVLVIGAGPAGCSAAIQCVRLGLDVAIVDSTGEAGGLIAEARWIENYPGLDEPISGQEFTRRLKRAIERFGLAVQKMHVDQISRKSRGFTIASREDSNVFPSLIIATGTIPIEFQLNTRGEVSIYRSILPLREHPPARAVVIGGGEAAADYALSLSDCGAAVSLILRDSRPRFTGRLMDQVEQRESVEIIYNTVLEEATENDGSILIRARDTEGVLELETDAVLAAVGREAQLPDVQGVFLHGTGDVITSIPGMFIAGDVSLGSLGQAGIAAGQGLQAAGMAAEHVSKVDR